MTPLGRIATLGNSAHGATLLRPGSHLLLLLIQMSLALMARRKTMKRHIRWT